MLSKFLLSDGTFKFIILGASSEVGTPDPIPNSAVKHFSADGSSLLSESKSVPRIMNLIC